METTNPTAVTLVSPGHWRVGTTRVSLDSVVIAYWNGESTRTIAENYPALTLHQVESALEWYLANRAAVDEGMAVTRQKWEEFRLQSLEQNRELRQKILARAAANVGAQT